MRFRTRARAVRGWQFGEQVQLGAGARRGHIRKPHALVRRAARFQRLQISAERIRTAVHARRNRRHEQIAAVRVARQLEPAQQRLLVRAELAAEARQNHFVELEALRAMDRHDLHRILGRRVMTHIQLCEALLERERAAPTRFRGPARESVEKGPRMAEILVARTSGRTAQPQPGVFHPA